MIVLDASAVLDLLLNVPGRAEIISERIAEEGPGLHAPHLLDVEVAQVLRRFVLRGELSPEQASDAFEDLDDLRITRYPHGPLLQRAFELRDNATMYDAVYLVLAEALGAPILTSDEALASVPGHEALVEVVGGGK